MNTSLDTRQSVLIEAMRFPLIVLVLLEHSVATNLAPMRRSLDGANVFHFTTELISHHLCSIAVCWFFVFSGFLFFRTLKDGQAGPAWFADKWKRRAHSLLFPYLFWNLFNVGAVLLVTTLFRKFGIPFSNDPLYSVERGPLFWFVTGPIDFPLWYVRDLIVMTVLTPLFWFLCKKAPKLSLALLAVIYIASYKTGGTLLEASAFFGVGAWMGIHRVNMLEICRSVRFPAAFLAVVLALLATSLYGDDLHQLFRLLFFPFGMITFMNICDRLIDCPRTRRDMLILSQTVFFVYAAHEIFILGWVKGALIRVFGATLPSRWLVYFAAPMLTLAICLALFRIFKRLTPHVLAFACGWRKRFNKV